MSTPDNPPAFPFVEPPTECNVNTGMTLRDYFAAKAMQSILLAAIQGNLVHKDGVSSLGPAHFAVAAYENADAMLAARNNQPATSHE